MEGGSEAGSEAARGRQIGTDRGKERYGRGLAGGRRQRDIVAARQEGGHGGEERGGDRELEVEGGMEVRREGGW